MFSKNRNAIDWKQIVLFSYIYNHFKYKFFLNISEISMHSSEKSSPRNFLWKLKTQKERYKTIEKQRKIVIFF